MVDAIFLAESWGLPDYRILRLLRAHADVLRSHIRWDSENRQLLITPEGVAVLAKLINHPRPPMGPTGTDEREASVA